MDDHFALLADIEAFCRVQGIAESTFGRQVVNDGKFVGRLRDGKGVTTATVARVHRHILENFPDDQAATPVRAAAGNGSTMAMSRAVPGSERDAPSESSTKNTFRFYDNRQMYLMFVNISTFYKLCFRENQQFVTQRDNLPSIIFYLWQNLV